MRLGAGSPRTKGTPGGQVTREIRIDAGAHLRSARRLRPSVLLLASLAAPATARAVPPSATSSVTPARRALAAGAAVFPGVLVHGTGHFTLGDADTGWTLLALEGLGLAGTVGGIAGLAVTGASPRTVVPLASLTVAGVGLFVGSFLGDLYGVLAPATGAPGPRARTWALQAQVGAAYVDDPVFSYGPFSTLRLDLGYDRWRLSPSAWVAIDEDNARLRLEGARRLSGNAAGYLDLIGAYTHHRYGSDGFAIHTPEVALAGRLDLAFLAPSLDGAFMDAGVGIALESHRFFGRGSTVTSLLLGGFGFGMYLGQGEFVLAYDHRHDGFAAGFKMPGLGSGIGGHFETRLSWFFGDLGVLLSAETGSAHVVHAALQIRGDG